MPMQFTPVPISCYILTLNSQKHLQTVIDSVKTAVDEIVILDSGSKDDTEKIAAANGCRFLYRKFDNYRDQRKYGVDACTHDWVFSLDCDEVASPEFAQHLISLKDTLNDTIGNLPADEVVYVIMRDWYAFGRKVHALFPVVSPDYPIRLFNKKKVHYTEKSNIVHEEPQGYQLKKTLQGRVHHYTFETKAELYKKLDAYSSFDAQMKLIKGWRSNPFKAWFSPIKYWIKFYVFYGNWKDGKTGLLLAKYGYDYKRLTYSKLKKLQSQKQP